jgi:hypothetical protein
MPGRILNMSTMTEQIRAVPGSRNAEANRIEAEIAEVRARKRAKIEAEYVRLIWAGELTPEQKLHFADALGFSAQDFISHRVTINRVLRNKAEQSATDWPTATAAAETAKRDAHAKAKSALIRDFAAALDRGRYDQIADLYGHCLAMPLGVSSAFLSDGGRIFPDAEVDAAVVAASALDYMKKTPGRLADELQDYRRKFPALFRDGE